MDVYRFVGVLASVGGLEFDQLGQKAYFEREQAKEAIRGGAAFVPEADFAAFLSDSEAADYSASYGDPPHDIAERVAQLRKLFRELRQEYLNDAQ